MDPAVLAAFAVVAAALVVLPGPDWALLLAASARPGVVAPTINGLVAGYVVLIGLVVAGIAPLLAAVPSALPVLTVVGAAYLLLLGARLCRGPALAGTAAAQRVGVESPHAAMVRGFAVSALNPKSMLFFVAFLPQFARPGAPWPVVAQLVLLGAVWIGLVAVVYSIVGRVACGVLEARPRTAAAVTRVAGVSMVLAGLALVVEQARHL